MSTSSVIQPHDIDLPVFDLADAPRTNSLREAKTCAVRDFERTYLVKTLVAFAGNISQAAKAAGKERRSFQRLLRKYGIDRQTFNRPS